MICKKDITEGNESNENMVNMIQESEMMKTNVICWLIKYG